MNRHQNMILHGILSQHKVDKTFVTTWSIPSDDFTLAWPTASLAGYSFDYDIDWGDGSPVENIKAPTGVSHTFSNAGIYKVKVKGVMPKWTLNNGAMKDYLIGVDNWGDVGFAYFANMFQGCSNLEYIKGKVVLSGNAGGMLRDCTVFNHPIGHWDVGAVTNMNRMFYASPFNQDIGNWNVGKVTDMSYMFRDSPFNQDIGNWNVGVVTNMNWMFCASPFNQDIGNWNVGKVTDMSCMFRDSPFNQDIGNWNVGNVTDMSYMFFNASAFNQDLSGWCVSKIPTRPTNFDSGATAWVLPNSRPIWGTCP